MYKRVLSERRPAAGRTHARSNPGRHGEPPARKSGSESMPAPSEGPIDPRRTPRPDTRKEEAPGEAGRGIPEKKGGKR